MKLRIHRGSSEIGGSCVEIWTNKTRIVIDMGMPIIDKHNKNFNIKNYENLGIKELIDKSILPNIKGLYDTSDNIIDGLIISHSHLDHYGLINYVNSDVSFYLGKATHKLIEISSIFSHSNYNIKNYTYFEKSKPFIIGNIKITPYWMDHSAFDSYSFLIESDCKSVFYSGDFRNHGRKSKVFKWFTRNSPKNIDYLLLEGTQIGRNEEKQITEIDIEKHLSKLFLEKEKINLIFTSGQNIDRLVSIYKACIKTNKILVIDVYIAMILKELSNFASIPYPSKQFNNIKVIFPYYISKRISSIDKNILYQFKEYKITKSEISINKNNIVMLVRPSMKKDLDLIEKLNNGNFIYSLWEGYLQENNNKLFVDYLVNRNFSIYKVHTSGHADIHTLKLMVDSLEPHYIIPIHTFNRNMYEQYFNIPIKIINDGECIDV